MYLLASCEMNGVKVGVDMCLGCIPTDSEELRDKYERCQEELVEQMLTAEFIKGWGVERKKYELSPQSRRYSFDGQVPRFECELCITIPSLTRPVYNGKSSMQNSPIKYRCVKGTVVGKHVVSTNIEGLYNYIDDLTKQVLSTYLKHGASEEFHNTVNKIP